MHLATKKFPFLIFIIFLISTLFFLIRTVTTKRVLFMDARYYYATTYSISINHNLDFTNEYQFLNVHEKLGSEGVPINIQPPGTSLFWLTPFNQTKHLLNLLSFFINFDFDTRQLIYQLVLGLVNIYIGVLGLIFCYLLVKTFFSSKVAQITIVILFATTNILLYIGFEPLNSHMPSLYISSLVIFYLVKKKKLESLDAFSLGGISGFAAVVRTQDAFIALLPIINLFFQEKRKLGNVFVKEALFVLGFLIGFTPQLYYWKTLFGTFWKSPYLSYGFGLTKLHITPVLFNLHNGFLTATPSTTLALVGLFLLTKKFPQISKQALSYFLIQLIVISSYGRFDQTDSFSIRMLITTYPFLALGFAQIVNVARRKYSWSKIIISIAYLSFINLFLILKFLNEFRHP